MSRRKRAERREAQVDSRFESTTAAKFINALMLDGKKSLAESIFYDALEIVEEKTGQPGLNVFRTALTNAKPALEVKSRRVGGATYQVPIEVRYERRQSLAIRWLIGFSKKRQEKSMHERLAMEILDAANSRGAAIKKKEDTHKMAEANKAFAHYRW